MNYIFDKIKLLQNTYGNNAPLVCGEEIKKIILSGKNSRFIKKINPNEMLPGYIYFVFYNLSSKASKMEQFSVVYHVLTKEVVPIKYNFSISLNFIPLNIRIALFGNMLKSKEKTFLDNELAKNIDVEKPLLELSYEQMYKILYAVGFEYSLRQFEVPRINKVYQLSTTLLPKILLTESNTFSGVPDSKLADIWSVKITQQEKRHVEQVNKLLKDYNNMGNTIENLIKDTQSSIKNADNIINNLSKLYK